MGIFSKIKGVREQESTNIIDDEILNTLDSSIRPLIKLCNENGINTFACCSGNLNEHPIIENASERGYVAFKDSKKARNITATLLDYEDLDISISTAYNEPYEYFGQIISGEKFCIYFENKQGQNMQNVYERFETAIKQKNAPSKNLKMINSLIEKFRQQSSEVEYNVEFNNISNPEGNCKACVWIDELPCLADEENVENVAKLSKDISYTLNTTDRNSDVGLVYVPESMGRNVLPVLDLIKKQVLSNKERYLISKDEIRKKYGEVYDEQEYEYLGYRYEYEKEHEIQSDFEKDLDNAFPKVSLEELNYTFAEGSIKNDRKPDGEFVI